MRRDKADERRIARERIARLFELAEAEAKRGEPARAARYVELARRVGMRYVVQLGRAHRRSFCRQCGAFLLPGRTARVRAREGKLAITCLACGGVRRFGYAREQRARRAHGR
ncbi:MAG TPA: ribonuclease P [Candidatus Thermoplasmatota archaeon]|nr:ribonuclease P [Candidatus Thermoplasmatota archaeon]